MLPWLSFSGNFQTNNFNNNPGKERITHLILCKLMYATGTWEIKFKWFLCDMFIYFLWKQSILFLICFLLKKSNILVLRIILFWFWLVAKESASSSSEPENNDELEQITIARALLNYRQKEKMAMSNPNATIPFPKKLQIQSPRPTSPQRPPAPTSKILPLICQKAAPRSRAPFSANKIPIPHAQTSALEGSATPRPQKFSAGAAALSYIPVHQYRTSCHGIAPPVTIRTTMPVYSAPPLPQPLKLPPQQVIRVPPVRIAPPVSIRQAIPVFAAPPVRKENAPAVKKEDCPAPAAPKENVAAPAPVPVPVPVPSLPTESAAEVEQDTTTLVNSQQEAKTLENLEELKIWWGDSLERDRIGEIVVWFCSNVRLSLLVCILFWVSTFSLFLFFRPVLLKTWVVERWKN